MRLIRMNYKAYERELIFTIDFKELQHLSLLKDFEKGIILDGFNTELDRTDSIIEYDRSFKARIEFRLTHACDLAEGLNLITNVSKELLKLKELAV